MKIPSKPKGPTQKEHRRGVTVGPRMTDVSPVMYWYRHDHFANDDEARGAFKLAYQQGLDGMGESIAAWMGMNNEEFDAWMRSEALPPKGGREASRVGGVPRRQVLIKVWGSAGADGWSIHDPEGGDPSDVLHPDAREAVDLAAEAHGGIPYHPSDGDVWIDLESDGDRDATLGVAIAYLAGKDYEVIVRRDETEGADG